MGKQISRSNLRVAVLAGIRDAYRLHKKTSKRRFGFAPEYWVTSMIARRLGKAAPGCGVELEASVREIMEQAKAKLPGRVPGWLRIGGRFDIVLWWKSKAVPRALIEVKHPVRKGAIPSVVKDARRLLTALHRGAQERNLDWACLAFYAQSSPKASRTKPGAKAEIAETLELLSAQVRELDKDKAFRVRLREAKNLILDASANGKEFRYGKPCCITIGRQPS